MARSCGAGIFFGDRALLGAAYKRYSGWAHGVAVTGAITADLLHPLGEVCGWLFLGALGLAVVLAFAIWNWRIKSEHLAAVLLFSAAARRSDGLCWRLQLEVDDRQARPGDKGG